MSIPPGTDTEKSSIGGVRLLNGIAHSKKRMRMTHKYLKPIQNYTTCPKCQNLKLLHVLCGHCLKETLRKTAAMRQEEQGKYKQ